MPFRIYLADLTHTGLGVATEAFPLNIGLIASYAVKRFGREIEVCLFKYPEELKTAIAQRPPHLLGCSNYTWNSHLAYHFVEWVKGIDPGIITVFGGTNYPFDPEQQKRFLSRRPRLDAHIFYKGEHAFSQLLERCLAVSDPSGVFAEPITGCQFIRKETGDLISGPPVPRIKELDEIPSPYATGLMDKFFDGRLTVLLETTRGCPFTCNFCNAGNRYFDRVNLFSDDYVREEWDYVARHAARVKVGHMTLADNNFGMIPRDRKTAELMYELKERYGWPVSVTAWTGKNSKQRVIDVTRLLKTTLTINMAVQSMDEGVLQGIERSNIRLEDYRAIAEELNAQGRPQVAELIVPLPEETWASHLEGLRLLLDSNVGTIVVHTLQMLHGTPYKDNDAYLREHGFVRKYRIVPLDFGIYDGRPIFDTEEVAVATNTFSLEEYLESRKLLLIIDLCYNGTLCESLKRYTCVQGLKISDWIQEIYRQASSFPPKVKRIFDSFVSETQEELWDSEEELVRYYSVPSHYEKLLRGEAGGNVLFKHKAWMLSEVAEEWIETVFQISERFFKEQAGPEAGREIQTELGQIKRYTLCSIAGGFELDNDPGVIREDFSFDLPAWLQHLPPARLADFKQERPVGLVFSFDPELLLIKRDALRRYGASRSGMIKLIQRLGDLRRFVRRVSYENGEKAGVLSHDGPRRILG